MARLTLKNPHAEEPEDGGRHRQTEGEPGRIGRGPILVDPSATPQETGKHVKDEED
jgi:hypothetical protein